jgi:hypothetical protein
MMPGNRVKDSAPYSTESTQPMATQRTSLHVSSKSSVLLLGGPASMRFPCQRHHHAVSPRFFSPWILLRFEDVAVLRLHGVLSLEARPCL